MKIGLTIRRFREGKKKWSEYRTPEASYSGTVDVPEIEGEDVDAVLFGSGRGLPIKVRWQDYNHCVSCVAMSEKVHFSLRAKLPTGEILAGNRVNGQKLGTGRRVNWSASMTVL